MPKGVYNHRRGYTRPKLSMEWRAKIAKAAKGNKSHWLGERASYRARHRYIDVYYGSPKFCEHCMRTDRKRYEWANISGEYKRERDDYKRLCRSCHIKWDIGRGVWGNVRLKQKELERSTTIIGTSYRDDGIV